MAIVVEDGTGLSNANAYAAVATIDTYHTDRANDDWSDADTEDKEAALIRATFALDYKYREVWKGVRRTQDQALAWPRIAKKDTTTAIEDDEGYDIAIDAVPQAVIYAVAEVALIELTQRFVTQEITRDDLVRKEKIGPLETEWFEGTTSVTQFPHIDAILDQVTSGDAASGEQMVVYLTEDEINQGESTDVFDYDAYFNIIKY